MKGRKSVHSLQAMTLALIGGGFGVPSLVLAQDSTSASAPVTQIQTVEVRGVNKAVNILSNEPVDSVFGFDKSVKDTPRSVTSITKETLDKLNIDSLDDLVALSPGSFTQSFFGVAGSLDLRGTPGENYFRGVRRIDNPGNYPTPIGASDRIDIVRGPASPIYGPSKIGGYLNFVPKSGRAEDGAYMKQPKGEFSATRGSWDKNVLHGEVGGPGELLDKKFGYYLYAETENSGSYYQNTELKQNLYQASFDSQLTESSRVEFGGMYQDVRTNQVAGWNRLTQDLVDNGTYITGSPNSLDTNGDGKMSAAESAAGDLGIFYFGGVGSKSATQVNSDLAAHPNMALNNAGTTHLKGYQVLVSPEDKNNSKVTTLYFDFIHDLSENYKLTNKAFYEKLENINENAYGFSQFANTYALEDQLNLAFKHTYGEYVKASYQLGASVRLQDFEHGDNFKYEYFDRRDISKPNTPVDVRTLSTRDGPVVEPWSSHTLGNYIDYGTAALADYTFFKNFHLLAGGRYDWVDLKSTACVVTSFACDGTPVTGFENSPSWSWSFSYDIPKTGVTPYITRASQSTLIVGQGGQVEPDNVSDGTALAKSHMTEYGAKGSWLKNRIYLSVANFKQDRVDLNSQDTVTNNTTLSKGWEFEGRGVVTNNLAITGAYTHLNVYNLSAQKNGNQFGFAGAGDLPAGVNPANMYGGVVNGVTFVNGSSNPEAKKAGVPEDMYSIYLIYNFNDGFLKGLTTTVGATHVSSTYSGFSHAVLLPSYTLLNAGVNYETKRWKMGLQGKNLLDERYFRSNFPDLFGDSIVLPELPANWAATLAYKF